MYRTRLITIILLTAVVVLFSVVASYAVNVPQLINYNGTLTDKNGAPVTGNFDMVFRIYDAPSGGNVLWSETWNSSTSKVTVVNGTYNVMLGFHNKNNNTNPLTADFFAQYPTAYLGIKVGTDSEMMPRQQITSVGYAFSAGNGVPKGGIIMWSGAVNQIPAGWALCDGTNGTPDLRDRFVVGAGNSYAVAATGGEATHTLTVNEMPSHNHGGTTGDYPMVRLGQKASSGNDEPVASQSNNHNHSIPLQGGGAAHENRPPYYALAFIMKL